MYPERINCQIYVTIDLGWCCEFALAEKVHIVMGNGKVITNICGGMDPGF